MKKIFYLIYTFLFTVNFTFANDIDFVKGIWFSQEKSIQHQPVIIYVAILNKTNSDKSASVIVFANNKKIAQKSIKAMANNISIAKINYNPNEYGKIKIIAQIQKSTDKTETSAYLTVLQDTDKDGIPDEKDLDDDNDGIPDKKDKNPKHPDNINQITQKNTVLLTEKIQDYIPLPQEITNQIKKAEKITKNIAIATKQTIDPLAQNVAEIAKQKSEQIKSKYNLQQASVIEALRGDTFSGAKEYFAFFLSEILAGLAFVLHHWIWHLLAALLLVVMAKIYNKYRKRKKFTTDYD